MRRSSVLRTLQAIAASASLAVGYAAVAGSGGWPGTSLYNLGSRWTNQDGATTALGFKPKTFIPSFILLYALSVAIFALGAWDQASTYNLEPPLVALAESVTPVALATAAGRTWPVRAA